MTDQTIIYALAALAVVLVTWFARGYWERRQPVTGIAEAEAAALAFKLGAELLAKAKKIQADPSSAAAETIKKATIDAKIQAAEQTLAQVSK